MSDATPAPPLLLLVDEDPAHLCWLQEALRPLGARVSRAAPGPEALAALGEPGLDVALVTVRGAPGGWLEQARAPGADVPLVLLQAGEGDPRRLLAGYALGAVDVLALPLPPEVLCARLAALLRLCQRGRALRKEVATKQRLLEALLEQMPSGFLLADPDGRLAYANPQAERVWGHPLIQAPDVHSYVAYRHYRPDGSEYPPEELPLARSVLHGEVVRGEVLWLRKEDADNRYIQVNSAPIRDEGGRTVAAVAIFDDITAERRSRERTRRLHAATSALAGALTPEDVARAVLGEVMEGLRAQGGVVYLLQEDGALRMLWYAGYDEDLVERFRVQAPDPALPGFVALETRAPVWVESLEVLRERFPALVDSVRGNQSWAVLPMLVQDREVGVLALAFARAGALAQEDRAFLTALAQQCAQALERARLYRQAEQAVRLRDDFLSIASHELKTPLTPLQLKLQGVRRELDMDGTPPRVRERVVRAIEGAEAQVRKLTGLVNDLLDVSRISAGKLMLDLEEVDLAALVHEVLARFTAQAHRAGCTLQVHAPPALVGHWDRQRLEQVVTNLLTNALKYGAGLPVRLRLEAGQQQARLEVTDEGIGIAPEDQARIFERFERAVSERHYGGLGLGLFITRQIVEALGGRVSVRSAPQRGACFEVVLPLRTAGG